MSNEIITNFTSGEITPQVDARDDIEKYAGACRQLENMIPDQFGNATKRPGTELIQISNAAACYWTTAPSNPDAIHIYTAEQLQKITFDPAYPVDGDYELMNDIDCSGISQWHPLGAWAIPYNWFTGTFDGRYFTISGINISQVDNTGDSSIGLFGYCVSADIRNIIVSGTIISNNGTVGSAIGLLVGSAFDTTITRCKATSTIRLNADVGNTKIGGLIGEMGNGTYVSECFSQLDYIALATARMTDNVGGLVGQVKSTPEVSTIINCYSQGTITDNGTTYNLTNVGGLIGSNVLNTIITNCYSAIIIKGIISSNVGGSIGKEEGGSSIYSSIFWDGTIDTKNLNDIGNTGNVANIIESTTTLMQMQSTFTDAGWDFTPNTGVWKIRPDDYPRHQWHYFVSECVWV